MPKGTENLWTKDDVAEYFNKNHQTITKWVRDGELKCCPNAPGNEPLFEPEYIRGLGRTEFKNGESSPEIKRMKRNYEREIEIKDRKILILETRLRNILTQAAQGINETSTETNANVELSVV